MTNRFMALLVWFTKNADTTPLGDVLSEEWFEVAHVKGF